MTESELVGTWIEERDDSVLVFKSDHLFTATNLPHHMFDAFPEDLPPGFQPGRDKLPAEGRWFLGNPGRIHDIGIDIDVLAASANGGRYILRWERSDGGLTVNYYVGDPDLENRITYRKCQKDCPVASS
ncbi:hypothetical protein KBX37_33280 [Micromonospora sp. U56]|uniref:hypothetical protein n=1 Tax=Micromonospora sp. U56 TaxID=2824900 RepID=UPI001B399482|nr:hypothetical protein [Micromonospora sp. U56]MBQ0897862.1 hypothetical protein [Micromonospora sp. U56]